MFVWGQRKWGGKNRFQSGIRKLVGDLYTHYFDCGDDLLDVYKNRTFYM